MKRTILSPVGFAWLAAAVTAGALAGWIWLDGPSAKSRDVVESMRVPALPQSSPIPLLQLLCTEATALTGCDIAVLNLACAAGLPGAEVVEPTKLLALLDAWAARVKVETDRHLYRFRQNPSEFERSEGFFRMLMLAVVLREDFGVHYTPERRQNPADTSTHDGFFADPADVLLMGLLGPKRQGTCSSLPVLYVAVGRRLGYPLKLVTTKGHLFVRWEDEHDRFNVEAAGEQVHRSDDAYYRQWPFAVAEEEIQAEGYLKSLTPPEELAVFLSIRGLCLKEAGRRTEAADSFAQAARLAPGCRSYAVMAASLGANLADYRVATTEPPKNSNARKRP